MAIGSPSSPLGIRIVATAAYLPGAPVSSEDVDRWAKLKQGTCEKRLGIRSRHFAGDMLTSEMAVQAARKALAAANWVADDLDLIVSASAVMEQWIPTQGILIQRQLGLADKGTPVLDVNATCLSFLSALDVISYPLSVGRYRRVLVVSSEKPSQALDWEKLEVCGNFGDGAAAVLLEQDTSGESQILSALFEAWSEGARTCELRAGGTLIDVRRDFEAVRKGAVFQMDGIGAYKLAAKHFPKFIRKLMATANITLADVSAIVPHQASATALDHLRRLSRVPKDKIVDIYAEVGNQVSASMPVALHQAIEQGRLKRGDIALLVGTAAGITLGGMALRY